MLFSMGAILRLLGLGLLGASQAYSSPFTFRNNLLFDIAHDDYRNIKGQTASLGIEIADLLIGCGNDKVWSGLVGMNVRLL